MAEESDRRDGWRQVVPPPAVGPWRDWRKFRDTVKEIILHVN